MGIRTAAGRQDGYKLLCTTIIRIPLSLQAVCLVQWSRRSKEGCGHGSDHPQGSVSFCLWDWSLGIKEHRQVGCLMKGRANGIPEALALSYGMGNTRIRNTCTIYLQNLDRIYNFLQAFHHIYNTSSLH